MEDASGLKRFWVGWKSGLLKTREPIFEYWLTGEYGVTGRTYTGVIDAVSEAATARVLKEVWPDVILRFCDEKPKDFKPRDRFSEAFVTLLGLDQFQSIHLHNRVD